MLSLRPVLEACRCDVSVDLYFWFFVRLSYLRIRHSWECLPSSIACVILGSRPSICPPPPPHRFMRGQYLRLYIYLMTLSRCETVSTSLIQCNCGRYKTKGPSLLSHPTKETPQNEFQHRGGLQAAFAFSMFFAERAFITTAIYDSLIGGAVG